MTAPAVETTSREKNLSGAAHLLGLIGALIIWLIEKDRSAYVRFQALQAAAYSFIVSAVIFILTIGMVLLSTFSALIFLVGITNADEQPLFGALVVPALLVAVFTSSITVPIGMLAWIPRLIAAGQTFQGKDFHYPRLGAWLEKRLKFDVARSTYD